VRSNPAGVQGGTFLKKEKEINKIILWEAHVAQLKSDGKINKG
jgi:hypothetical protein